MKGVFARNADGTVKHKKPCQTPGCGSPNWHLCIKANTTDRFPELLRLPRFGTAGSVLSDSHREQISEAMKERWAKVRAENKPRDDKIIELYAAGGISTTDLAKEFRLGRDRILRILRDAQKEGRVTIRPKGTTIRNGA